MKIVGWTDWDDPQYREKFPIEENCSIEEDREVRELIAKELRDKGYKFSGQYHQNGDFGVPVFDDGTVYQCTQRTWGNIMVMAYPEEIDNSDGLGYCSWAWDTHTPMSSVYPNNNDYYVTCKC